MAERFSKRDLRQSHFRPGVSDFRHNVPTISTCASYTAGSITTASTVCDCLESERTRCLGCLIGELISRNEKETTKHRFYDRSRVNGAFRDLSWRDVLLSNTLGAGPRALSLIKSLNIQPTCKSGRHQLRLHQFEFHSLALIVLCKWLSLPLFACVCAVAATNLMA